MSWDLAKGTNVAWNTAIPGLGHSSPIVWGDRVYVTTAVATTGKEAPPVTGVMDVVGVAMATVVVVGSRNEADTFPNGFFQAWKLNTNTGWFERLARA